MSDHRTPAYGYAAIRRQMQRVTGDHERHVKTAWVNRVLGILNSDNLITKAASGWATGNSLIFECNVAAHVWDDPRIAYRLRQLEGDGLAVELVDHENEIAGKTFKRTQIRITFDS